MCLFSKLALKVLLKTPDEKNNQIFAFYYPFVFTIYKRIFWLCHFYRLST